jgi:hypothetical protein
MGRVCTTEVSLGRVTLLQRLASGQSEQPTVGATYDCCRAFLISSEDADFSKNRAPFDRLSFQRIV